MKPTFCPTQNDKNKRVWSLQTIFVVLENCQLVADFECEPFSNIFKILEQLQYWNLLLLHVSVESFLVLVSFFKTGKYLYVAMTMIMMEAMTWLASSRQQQQNCWKVQKKKKEKFFHASIQKRRIRRNMLILGRLNSLVVKYENMYFCYEFNSLMFFDNRWRCSYHFKRNFFTVSVIHPCFVMLW